MSRYRDGTGMTVCGNIDIGFCCFNSHKRLFQQYALLWIRCIGFRCSHLEEIGIEHVNIITKTSKPASTKHCTR